MPAGWARRRRRSWRDAAGPGAAAKRQLDDADALRLAAEIEGHPDNVAPCLLGGFTIAWTEPTTPTTIGGARAVRLPSHPDARLTSTFRRSAA